MNAMVARRYVWMSCSAGAAARCTMTYFDGKRERKWEEDMIPTELDEEEDIKEQEEDEKLQTGKRG